MSNETEETAVTRLAITDTNTPAEVSAQQIADLAFYNWQQRGCPDGSPEEDWLRAEAQLAAKAASA